MNCGNCGQPLKASVMFCGACGTRADPNAVPIVAPPALAKPEEVVPTDPGEPVPRARPLPWGRRRILVVAGSAAAALLVLVGAGVGIGAAISAASRPSIVAGQNGDGDSDAEADGVGGDSVAGIPTSTPSPDVVGEIEPYRFSSPSGNLRCYVDAEVAWCHQGAIQYAEPAADCAAEGVAIGVSADGPLWPCLDRRPELSAAVEYDAPIVHGDFSCVINYTRGATCTNPSGSGFTIEYKSGVSTF